MKLRIFLSLFVFCWFLSASEVESGSIAGKVAVRQSKKAKRPARYHLGPYRSARRSDTQKSSGPQDVVIHLEGPGIKPATGSSDSTVKMLQKDEAFVPHVLPVLAGTTVEFPNKDDFYHNVFSVMSGDRFDLGRYAKGGSAKAIFDKPGIVVVRCEIHSGMKAYIVVLETPHFTVPNTTGAFSLVDVPAGTYNLEAWHPNQGRKQQTITVPESGIVNVDISF
jgi:plastocyanin